MNEIVRRIKTPISYYGGKQTMLKYILPLIPSHITYTEAFAGGAAVFWAKEPSEVEVINDTNCELINFYTVLVNKFDELKTKIDQTIHARDYHCLAGFMYNFPQFFNDIERAWAVWVLSKMSFASRLNASFGYDKTKNTQCKKIRNAKDNFTECLLKRRLENATIENVDALQVITSRDSEDTFHFVDPPYVGSNQGHYSGYIDENFKELLNVLEKIKGKFMLTMYPNDILSSYINRNGWNVVDVHKTISASKVNRRKQVELIVYNYNM